MVDNHTRRSPLVDRDPRNLDTNLNIRPVPILLGVTRGASRKFTTLWMFHVPWFNHSKIEFSDEGLEAAAALYMKHQASFASPDMFKKKVLPPLMKSLFGTWKGGQLDLLEAVFRWKAFSKWLCFGNYCTSNHLTFQAILQGGYLRWHRSYGSGARWALYLSMFMDLSTGWPNKCLFCDC